MADGQIVYRIIDWDEHFENSKSRTLKRLDWVPVPTKQDGDGYTELVTHKHGAAHLGCWLAIIQVAARCHPRGTLVRSSGRAVSGAVMPHDCNSLSRMTRLAADTLADAIERLCSIGWLERLTLTGSGLTAIRHHDDTMVSREGQGSTVHGMEENTISSSPSGDSVRAAPVSAAQIEAVYQAYPRHVGKGNAVKVIKVAIREVGYAELLAAVQRYAASRNGEDTQFTPHPATWFRAKRWLDEPDAPKFDLSLVEDRKP